jgi:hypothetical protein
MESEISLTPQAKVRTEPWPVAFETPGSEVPKRPQKEWIAKDDWLGELHSLGSFRFVLSRQLSQSLLGFLYVIHGQFAGFNQMRHHRLGPAAK